LTDLLVVDCSVAVKWAVDEPLHAAARLILGESSRLIAPELLLAEVANVASRKHARSEISRSQGAELVRLVAAAIGTWYAMREIALRAFHLAHILDHPAYDCCYLALAELTGGRMLTDDRDFASRARSRGFDAHILRLVDLSSSER
jgi:predicted nucleic acid-binding protein